MPAVGRVTVENANGAHGHPESAQPTYSTIIFVVDRMVVIPGDGHATGGAHRDRRRTPRGSERSSAAPGWEKGEVGMNQVSWAEALVIGAVQGVTELFPVCSLGHAV